MGEWANRFERVTHWGVAGSGLLYALLHLLLAAALLSVRLAPECHRQRAGLLRAVQPQVRVLLHYRRRPFTGGPSTARSRPQADCTAGPPLTKLRERVSSSYALTPSYIW